MSTLTIITHPHDNLSIVAEEVQEIDQEIDTLIKKMKNTMYANNGIGLAATQVDVHKRVFVMDTTGEEFYAFINPKILTATGDTESEEGCLSVPETIATVKRKEHIKVSYFDIYEKAHIIEFDGLNAICIQHEIDHLNGVLFIDYLSQLKKDIITKKIKKLRKIT